MTRLFGTDGIRGPAGEPPLDRRTLTRLGTVLGGLLQESHDQPSVLIGGDTRDSTSAIASALAAGLTGSGVEVRYGGVLPTPAVARMTADLGCSAGIAVSASHNRHPDNGVKLLDARGGKWSEAAERKLEARFRSSESAVAGSESIPSSGPDLDSDSNSIPSTLQPEPDLASRYVERVAGLFAPDALAGLELVLDAAHGAATPVASRLFGRLGAAVDLIGADPNGTNINNGHGSTHPEAAVHRVLETGADLGFAFDGDADRAVAIDARGTVHDGDAILYVLATWLEGRGALTPPRIVVTSMSNLGLEVALERRGIEAVRCDVGDRAVVETLIREDLALGGEQSGHIVLRDLTPTGDGLLTAALVARVVAETGTPLERLTEPFQRYPQILRNVRVEAKPPLESLPEVMAAARAVEDALGADGRLVLRYSGTEPLARIMIEGPEQSLIEGYAGRIAAAIESRLALPAESR